MTEFAPTQESGNRIRRTRAIILTGRGTILFIKRVKPQGEPYWVAPGGGMEAQDPTLLDALHRELCEELGASVEVLEHAFVLEHTMGGKDLEEHFYVCRLLDYDLSLRSGPEFNDPGRGEFIPHEVELHTDAINALNIKTPELRDWLLANIPDLRHVS